MPQTLLRRIISDPGLLLSVSTVSDPCPGRVVVEVVGEVDGYTAPALGACLQSQASQPGVRELVVDLGGVTFLGAAGIEVLSHADRRCRGRGVRLVVRTGGRRAVFCPLRLTGLADRVVVDPDVDPDVDRVRPGRHAAPRRGHDVVADARQ